MNQLLQFLVELEQRFDVLSDEEHEKSEREALEILKEIAPKEINNKDTQQLHTALYYAINFSFPVLIKELLQKKTDINVRYKDQRGWTPLHLWFFGMNPPEGLSPYYQKKAASVLAVLLQYHPNIALEDNDGSNVIQYITEAFEPDHECWQECKKVFIEYFQRVCGECENRSKNWFHLFYSRKLLDRLNIGLQHAEFFEIPKSFMQKMYPHFLFWRRISQWVSWIASAGAIISFITLGLQFIFKTITRNRRENDLSSIGYVGKCTQKIPPVAAAVTGPVSLLFLWGGKHFYRMAFNLENHCQEKSAKMKNRLE